MLERVRPRWSRTEGCYVACVRFVLQVEVVLLQLLLHQVAQRCYWCRHLPASC